MNRTFHHNVSLQGIATIVLLAVAALWCFLVRSGITPVLGFVCLLIGAAGVDRLVHTTYTFTADGNIVIEYGCGKITYAQPQQTKEFIEEIRRRQKITSN